MIVMLKVTSSTTTTTWLRFGQGNAFIEISTFLKMSVGSAWDSNSEELRREVSSEGVGVGPVARQT